MTNTLKNTPPDARELIETEALIARLHEIAMGRVEANGAQLTAIKALLGKVIPDVRSGDYEMPGASPLPERIEIEFVRSQAQRPGRP